MAESLVTVDAFKFQADAATAKVLLEGEGIPAFLQNANAVGALPVGDIELQVRPADEARARATLSNLQRGGTESDPKSPPRSTPEKCLSCGTPMPAQAESCPACGWTFRGEELVSFANGPVPASMIPRAWSPMGSRRFGFGPDDVPRYVEWCARERLEIEGWELWGRSTLGHTLLSNEEEGGAAALLAAAATVPRDRAPGVYFSMNVLPRAGAAAAGS